MALVAYNLLATLRAAVASVHGVGKIEASLSDFYLVDEIQSTYRGMMIAIPPVTWQCFTDFSLADVVLLLLDLAEQVSLTRFLKQRRIDSEVSSELCATRQPRAPKKKKPPLTKDPLHPHVSTAKLLAAQ